MKDSGRTICNTDREKRLGQMEAFTKVFISQVKSMVQGCMLGTMGLAMMESGSRTRSEGRVHTHGSTVVSIRENGLTITWRAWASTLGRMEDAMRDSTETTRSTGTEYTHGLITECIRGCGSVENSTDSATTQSQEVTPRLASGKTASALNGSIMTLFKRSSQGR